MSLRECLLAGIAALVPTLAFGQVPDILELRDATKDAFEATTKAFDNIEANRAKNSAGARKGSTPSKAAGKQGSSFRVPEKQDNASSTMFSRIGERSSRSNAVSPSNEEPTPSALEKKVLGFLGSSADVVYRGMFSVVGIAFVFCVGVRVKEKVKDLSTGRPSLSRSKIIRR